MEQQSKSPLDPLERISEVLFGIIMVLTFTCSISVADADHQELRTTLLGALSCNLAWGIVDAVMYIMGILTERAREMRLTNAPPPKLTSQDWLNAFSVFLLVFLSTFPVVIPFIVMHNKMHALRVSNLIANVMLFGLGYWLGKYAGLRPIRTGIAMVLVGIVLVAITIALGG